MLQIPGVLNAEQVRCLSADAGRGATGGTAASPPASSRRVAKDNAQVPEDDPVARRPGRHDRCRAGANAAVPVGGVAAAGVSAAVQPLRRRPGIRHPCRQCDPPGQGHAAPHPHRSVGDAVPDAARRLRRRRADGRRTFRRAAGEAAGRRTWCCIPPAACTTSPRSPAAPGSPRSSGSRAWSATMPGARCCSTSTRAIQALGRDVPDHDGVVQLTGVYHNLIRQWAEL